MLLFALFLNLLPLCTLAQGPTFKEFDAIICPSDKPVKCTPYGVCCGYDEFCYQGMCESCLPHRLQDRDQQLTWCQKHGVHNVSKMRDGSCRVACQAKFSLHELTGHSKPTEEKLSEIKPTDNTWFHLFLAMSVACCVFLLLLLVMAAISLILYRNIMLRHRRDHHFGALERRSKRHSRRHIPVSDGEDAADRYISLEPAGPPEIPPPRTASSANGKYLPRTGSEVKDTLKNESETLTVQSDNSG